LPQDVPNHAFVISNSFFARGKFFIKKLRRNRTDVDSKLDGRARDKKKAKKTIDSAWRRRCITALAVEEAKFYEEQLSDFRGVKTKPARSRCLRIISSSLARLA